MEDTSQGNQTLSVTVKNKIIRARIRLVGMKPFFGRLSMMLTPCENNSVPTASTDGESLFYNPNFIDKLGEDELRGVLLHEVLHPSLGHLWRRGERDPHRWNYACDYVVNQILLDNGFTLIKGGLKNSKFGKMMAEQVYDLLKTTQSNQCPACGNIKQNKDGDGSDGDGEKKEGCGVCNSHEKWNSKSKDKKTSRQLEKMWQAATTDALRASQERGDVPAGFERIVEEMEAKEDWKKILSSYLSISQSDFDFMRQDRRFLDADFYLPDLYEETNLEDVVVAVDTSGSITDDLIKKFVAETRGIINQFGRVKGWLVDCDCEIGEFIELEKGLEKKNWNGGGGTSHIPVFNEIKKRGVSPKVLIAFTDLYTEYPNKEPDFPVIWVVPGKYASNEDPPFGRVVRLKGEF